MVNKLSRVLATITIVLWPSLALAAFPSSGKSVPQKNYNLITDFGATCNGVADDAPAFSTATTTIAADPVANAGADVFVFIPPGSHCLLNSCTGSFYFSSGTYGNLTLVATGATVTNNNGTCTNWGQGRANGFGFNTLSNTFAAVSAGASCVTLTTPATASNYPVGSWAYTLAIGTQANSYPANPSIYQWVQIASANAGTGQVCFTQALLDNYKAAPPWIDFGPGHTGDQCSNTPCGSNGYLVGTIGNFAKRVYHFKGGTWTNSTPNHIDGAYIIFDSMTWGGSGQVCWFPSQHISVLWVNISAPNCDIEMDKIVDNLVLDNSLIGDIRYQSAGSFKNTTLQNNSQSTFIGMPRHSFCNNSKIKLQQIGPTFGFTHSFAGVNCTFVAAMPASLGGANTISLDDTPPCCFGLTFSYQGSGTFLASQTSVGQAHGVVNSCFGSSDSTGLSCMQLPQFSYPGPSSEPPAVFFWSCGANSGCGYSFKVSDHSWTPLSAGDSNGHLNIVTSMTGVSLPTGIDTAGNGQALPDNMRSWSCSNCTGNADAIDLSQPGAQNAPLWTYSKRTYTCANNLANVPNSLDIDVNHSGLNVGQHVFGVFTFAKITVTQADTTGATPVFQPFGPFTYSLVDQSGTLTSVNIASNAIDLTRTGLRTINPTTTSGSVGTDALTPPGFTRAWIEGGSAFPFSNLVLAGEPANQCPVVTVELQADRTTLIYP
jgi:hypothetical protein